MHAANREPYLAAARAHISLLAKYERANSNFVVVDQGREDPNFWQVFGFETKPSIAYSH